MSRSCDAWPLPCQGNKLRNQPLGVHTFRQLSAASGAGPSCSMQLNSRLDKVVSPERSRSSGPRSHCDEMCSSCKLAAQPASISCIARAVARQPRKS